MRPGGRSIAEYPQLADPLFIDKVRALEVRHEVSGRKEGPPSIALQSSPLSLLYLTGGTKLNTFMTNRKVYPPLAARHRTTCPFFGSPAPL